MEESDKTLETLGDRLRYARTLSGKNQSEVADYINKTTVAYGHYERNRNEMSFDIATKLCEVLDINYEWLMAGTGEMKPSEYNQVSSWAKEIDDFRDSLSDEERQHFDSMIEIQKTILKGKK